MSSVDELALGIKRSRDDTAAALKELVAAGRAVPITNPNASSHTVRDLPPGTWFFAVSAYDDNGFESNLSSEISRTL